ncbi:hypothetical protein JOE40_000773 [Arthrobacter sp. PvP102]|uniref:COG1470 family protein n=1 Tax=unclassified Arthrobacter TaxID=235627 RepID=UPI001AE7A6B2|nr:MULTISPECIES: hypothetical protein [unclassified Arthrobacter]MBP1235305.1 hypothetical protein [Arthrobacter sp. PvP103]MBP1236264.1 hypothetical protein [Arthrobacter sp. PvP102]
MREHDGHPRHRLRPAIKAALIGLVVMLASAGGVFAAAAQNPKPGITVQASPASQSVQQGQGASYVLTLTSTGGFTGPVGLAVAGLPSSSTATFSPASLTLAAGGTSSATMKLTTAPTTPAGTNELTITGTSGKISGSVPAGLTVNYRMTTAFSLGTAPASVTVPPGATAVYTVQVTRNNFTGPLTFSVMGGLPAGATASFSPNPVTGGATSLQISTAAASPDGSYNLYLVSSGQDAAGKTQYAYANTELVLDSTKKQFTLSANTPGSLSPGTSAGLDLRISNPNTKPLSLTNISVALAGVTRSADALNRNLPCTAADYTLTQYNGPYPLTVQPGSTTLSGLGIAPSNIPRVSMLDTRTNQDGCKGATLQLTYSGSGQGN